MAFEFKLPDLGEGIHEAQIIGVKIAEGQTVKEDQMVLEVETDKAAVEIPIPKGGVVSKLLVKAGDTVKVGQVLIVIGDGGAAAPAPVAAAAPPAPAARPAAAAAAPAMRGNGDGAGLVTAATAPPRLSMPAPVAASAPAAIVHAGPVPATPAVRRLAREIGVDLRTVAGSGPGGRVLAEDVERASRGGGTATMAPPTPAPVPAPATRPVAPPSAAPSYAPAAAEAPVPATGEALPDFAQWGPITREPVPQIRKAIAKQMARAWQMVPRVTHGDEADLTELDEFRRQHSKSVEAAGGKLTVTVFVVKALAAALQKHPKLNCSYDERTHEVIWKHYVHLGIAVDSPRGLIVPCLRDVDKKSLGQVARELTDLGNRVRESKFDIAELRGGTFTLSNVGALGGTFSTPMVNYPETAILVTGRLAKKPVVKDDRIVIRSMMPLSLSFDHRIIDGADAARFTKTLVELLENPIALLMTA